MTAMFDVNKNMLAVNQLVKNLYTERKQVDLRIDSCQCVEKLAQVHFFSSVLLPKPTIYRNINAGIFWEYLCMAQNHLSRSDIQFVASFLQDHSCFSASSDSFGIVLRCLKMFSFYESIFHLPNKQKPKK